MRTAAALDIDDVLYIAADLLERLLQHFRFVRLAEQPIEPREVDVDYGHRGRPFWQDVPASTMRMEDAGCRGEGMRARFSSLPPASCIPHPLINDIAAPFPGRRDWCRTVRGYPRRRSGSSQGVRCRGPRRGPGICSQGAT